MAVTLSAAKGLARRTQRSFAEFPLSEAHGLRMTGLDVAGGEDLSRSFEPCVSSNVSIDVDSARRSVHDVAETWKTPTQAWTKYQISAQAWKKVS